MRRSWLGVWVGIELNLIRFIPILLQSRKISGEAAVKYFLIQVSGSFLLLISSLGFVNDYLYFSILIRVSLLIKIGRAPFHFWYPILSEEIEWVQFGLLRTIQKFSPLMLLYYTLSNFISSLLYLRVILRGFIGAAGGLNEISLRKLLAFSSINHLGWILIPIIEFSLFWIVYFLCYCLLVFMVIFNFRSLKIYHLNQMLSFLTSNISKICLAVRLLSLGGIPPLLGFFPKWGLLQFIRLNSSLFVLVFIIFIRVITLFFYTRICVRAIYLSKQKKIKKENFYKKEISILLINIRGFWIVGIYIIRF